jgi:aspartyl/asparaginyl-tRNA synthetase
VCMRASSWRKLFVWVHKVGTTGRVEVHGVVMAASIQLAGIETEMSHSAILPHNSLLTFMRTVWTVFNEIRTEERQSSVDLKNFRILIVMY